VPLVAAFGGLLAARRRLPLLALAYAIVMILVSHELATALVNTGTFTLAIVLAIYSSGAYTEGGETVVAAGLMAAAIPLAALDPSEHLTLSDLAFFVAFFVGPFAAGRLIRQRRMREQRLEDSAAQLRRSAEERVRAAVTDERARIARDLHDVVSHAVSVIILQARGARRVLNGADDVRGALDTIEASGRQALQEMRRLLVVLREAADEASLAPQPSLRHLEALVASMQGAGLRIDVCIEGDLNRVPPGIDVAAYRIVQEALTNVLKHAGAVAVRIHVSCTDASLELAISNSPGRVPDAVVGAGHGLIGMRERVAVYGGELRAGVCASGGYEVWAQLPIGANG
jgi:signal transduction histidine kinase